MINVLRGKISPDTQEADQPILLIERDSNELLAFVPATHQIREKIKDFASAGLEVLFYFQVKQDQLLLYEVKEIDPGSQVIPIFHQGLLFCTSCKSRITNPNEPCSCDYCPDCASPYWINCPTCNFHERRSTEAGVPKRLTGYLLRGNEEQSLCITVGGHTLCGHEVQAGDQKDEGPHSCIDCTAVLAELCIIRSEMFQIG